MLKLLIVAFLFVSIVTCIDVRFESIRRSDDSFIYDSDAPVVAAHGDTIVALDLIDPANSSSYGYSVFKRQDDGLYKKIQTVAAPSNPSPVIFNNGKWMGGWSYEGQFRIFQVDANGNVANEIDVIPDVPNGIERHAVLLTDNTIVYYDRWRQIFSSLIFNANNTWSAGPSFAAPYLNQMYFPTTTYWITDAHIVWMNESLHTHIYTRQQDGSWIYIDGFAFNASIVDYDGDVTLYYNDIDTVVFTFPYADNGGSDGLMVLNTKVNNVWTTQLITSPQLTLQDDWPGLGYGSIASIDDDTLIFGAQYEDGSKKRGSLYSKPLGRVLIIQRKNDVWVPSAVIYSEDYGYLGARVMVTNNDLVFTFNAEWLQAGRKYLFHTVPRCILAPIDVTCSNIEVSTCQIDTSDPNPLAYFFGNQCEGFKETVSVTRVKFEDFQVLADLEFSRALSTASCTATLTCPRTPSQAESVVSGSSIISAALPLITLAAFVLLALE